MIFQSFSFFNLLWVGAFFVVAILVYELYRRSKLFDPKTLSLQLLHIKLAKSEGEKNQDLVKEIALSEQLFSSLASLETPRTPIPVVLVPPMPVPVPEA